MVLGGQEYVCMYGFYGAYNCYSLVRQLSGFITVSVSVSGNMSQSRMLDLRAEESCVTGHMKPPHCGEASRKPRALSWDRTRVIVSLVHGFTY